MEPGWLTILDSATIHNGGGKPLGDHQEKYIAFFTISSDVLNYDHNQCVMASALLSQASPIQRPPSPLEGFPKLLGPIFWIASAM